MHEVTIHHLFVSQGHNFIGHHGKEPGSHPMEEVANDTDPKMKPLMYNTLAMLASESGDLKKAIAAQQMAIDATDDERQKKRLQVMLDELKQKAAEGSAGDASEK